MGSNFFDNRLAWQTKKPPGCFLFPLNVITITAVLPPAPTASGKQDPLKTHAPDPGTQLASMSRRRSD